MAEQMDLPYSEAHTDRRMIDVFTPDGQGNGAAVLWIHGGGFTAGDKSQWHSVCRHFAGLGYVCASPGYRFSPEWTFPAWVEDVRLAMAWFKANAGTFGFDPTRVATAGSSAGGYLALMLGTIGADDDLAATSELGDAGTQPKAIVAYCPAISMHDARRTWERAAYPKLMPAPEHEDPELYRIASIEDRVAAGQPPVLILHGTADALIPYAESKSLAMAIKAVGGAVELVGLDGAEHGFGYGVETANQRAAIAHAAKFLSETL